MFFYSWEFLSRNCGHLSSNILCPFSWRLDCLTFTVLLLISCIISSECVSSKEENERYSFSHTAVSPNGNLMTCMGFLLRKHMLFSLFNFLLEVNHAPSKKNTWFPILFMRFIEPVAKHVTTFCIFFKRHCWGGIFFYKSCGHLFLQVT